MKKYVVLSCVQDKKSCRQETRLFSPDGRLPEFSKKAGFLFLSISLILAFTLIGEVSAKEKPAIVVTILYDNYVFTDGLTAEWGFSCLVKGTEKTILFDAGRSSDILSENISKLKADMKTVDLLAISHNHHDHIGGLFSFLDMNNNVTAYLPTSFTDPFVEKMENTKAKVVRADKPVEICRNVFLTGDMKKMEKGIREQSLIINTSKGLLIIVGCSHPGIVNIVKKAKEMFGKEVYLVFGGFHLLDETEDDVKKVVGQFKEMGVVKVGPTHCTGDKAIELFKTAYAENYVQMGVGKVVRISDQDK